MSQKNNPTDLTAISTKTGTTPGQQTLASHQQGPTEPPKHADNQQPIQGAPYFWNKFRSRTRNIPAALDHVSTRPGLCDQVCDAPRYHNHLMAGSTSHIED